MDLRQTKEYADYMHRRGWRVLDVGGYAYLKKIPLLPFSVLKCQRAIKIDWRKLEEVRKRHWVVLTIIEPVDNDFARENKGKLARYHINKESYLPTKTLVVDLNKSTQTLLREVKKDVRQVLKRENGIEIEEVKDLAFFRSQWQKSKKGYLPSVDELEKMKNSFGKKMLVLGAFRDKKLRAGTVILMGDKTAYYYFAWTDTEGREIGAQYMLVWEGMMRAKRRGYKSWDFEGIDDKRFPRKTWKGFSDFKKKFGGKEVSYPPCYQRWF